MNEGTVGVKQAAAADRKIANEVLENGNGDTVHRQEVLSHRAPVTSLVGTRDVTGVTTLHATDPGKRLRVVRVWLRGAKAVGDNAVEFELKLGSTVIDRDEVEGSVPYIHGQTREGDDGADLTLELFVAGRKTFYNVDVVEITEGVEP